MQGVGRWQDVGRHWAAAQVGPPGWGSTGRQQCAARHGAAHRTPGVQQNMHCPHTQLRVQPGTAPRYCHQRSMGTLPAPHLGAALASISCCISFVRGGAGGGGRHGCSSSGCQARGSCTAPPTAASSAERKRGGCVAPSQEACCPLAAATSRAVMLASRARSCSACCPTCAQRSRGAREATVGCDFLAQAPKNSGLR